MRNFETVGVERRKYADLRDAHAPLWTLERARAEFWQGSDNLCKGSDGVTYRLLDEAIINDLGSATALPGAGGHGDVILNYTSSLRYWFDGREYVDGVVNPDANTWVSFGDGFIGKVPPNPEIDPTVSGQGSWINALYEYATTDTVSDIDSRLSVLESKDSFATHDPLLHGGGTHNHVVYSPNGYYLVAGADVGGLRYQVADDPVWKYLPTNNSNASRQIASVAVTDDGIIYALCGNGSTFGELLRVNIQTGAIDALVTNLDIRANSLSDGDTDPRLRPVGWLISIDETNGIIRFGSEDGLHAYDIAADTSSVIALAGVSVRAIAHHNHAVINSPAYLDVATISQGVVRVSDLTGAATTTSLLTATRCEDVSIVDSTAGSFMAACHDQGVFYYDGTTETNVTPTLASGTGQNTATTLWAATAVADIAGTKQAAVSSINPDSGEWIYRAANIETAAASSWTNATVNPATINLGSNHLQPSNRLLGGTAETGEYLSGTWALLFDPIDATGNKLFASGTLSLYKTENFAAAANDITWHTYNNALSVVTITDISSDGTNLLIAAADNNSYVLPLNQLLTGEPTRVPFNGLGGGSSISAVGEGADKVTVFLPFKDSAPLHSNNDVVYHRGSEPANSWTTTGFNAQMNGFGSLNPGEVPRAGGEYFWNNGDGTYSLVVQADGIGYVRSTYTLATGIWSNWTKHSQGPSGTVAQLTTANNNQRRPLTGKTDGSVLFGMYYGLQGIWRSTDGGDVWDQIATPIASSNAARTGRIAYIESQDVLVVSNATKTYRINAASTTATVTEITGVGACQITVGNDDCTYLHVRSTGDLLCFENIGAATSIGDGDQIANTEYQRRVPDLANGMFAVNSNGTDYGLTYYQGSGLVAWTIPSSASTDDDGYKPVRNDTTVAQPGDKLKVYPAGTTFTGPAIDGETDTVLSRRLQIGPTSTDTRPILVVVDNVESQDVPVYLVGPLRDAKTGDQDNFYIYPEDGIIQIIPNHDDGVWDIHVLGRDGLDALPSEFADTKHVVTFAEAMATKTSMQFIKTACHGNSQRGASTYVRTSTSGLPSTGDEGLFYDANGAGWQLLAIDACKATQFGAVDGGDITDAAQAALYYAAEHDVPIAFIDVSFGKISKSLETRRDFTGGFKSITIRGYRNPTKNDEGGTKLEYNGPPNTYMIGVHQGREFIVSDMNLTRLRPGTDLESSLKDIDVKDQITATFFDTWSAALTSDGIVSGRRYSPDCAIAIDPYAVSTGNTAPGSGDIDKYPEDVISYGDPGFTSSVTVKRVIMTGFEVGVAMSPGLSLSQADWMSFDNTRVENCVYGYSLNHSNHRSFGGENMRYVNTWCFVTSARHGSQSTGTLRGVVTRGGGGGFVGKLVELGNFSAGAGLTFIGFDAENMWRIGDSYGSNDNDGTLLFDNCVFKEYISYNDGVTHAVPDNLFKCDTGDKGAVIEIRGGRFDSIGANSFVGVQVKIDGSASRHQGEPITKEYMRKAINGMAGGFMALPGRGSKINPKHLALGIDGTNDADRSLTPSIDYTYTNRDYGIPIADNVLYRQRHHGNTRINNYSVRVNTSSKPYYISGAKVLSKVRTERAITLDLDLSYGENNWIQRGLSNGSIGYHDATGTVVAVRSVDSINTTITVELLNNYYFSGTDYQLVNSDVETDSGFWVFCAVPFLAPQRITGSINTASDVINVRQVADPIADYGLEVGDYLFVDNIEAATFNTGQRAEISAIDTVAGTITMSGNASADHEDIDFDLWITAPPANETSR